MAAAAPKKHRDGVFLPKTVTRSNIYIRRFGRKILLFFTKKCYTDFMCPPFGGCDLNKSTAQKPKYMNTKEHRYNDDKKDSSVAAGSPKPRPF